MQIGNARQHIFELLPARIPQSLRIDDADTQWHIEERLLTQRRGDDDFLEYVVTSSERNRRETQSKNEDGNTHDRSSSEDPDCDVNEAARGRMPLTRGDRILNSECMTCSLRRY